jgi:hypothetical protein
LTPLKRFTPLASHIALCVLYQFYPRLSYQKLKCSIPDQLQ